MMQAFFHIDDHRRAVAAVAADIAKSIARSPAQVALTWLRQQPGVVIPIIGARRLSQLKDNLACVEFTLEPEHMKRLNELSRIDMGFPHGFFANDMVRQFA